MNSGSWFHAVTAAAALAAGLAATPGAARAGETPLKLSGTPPLTVTDGPAARPGANPSLPDIPTAGVPARFPDLRDMNLTLTPPAYLPAAGQTATPPADDPTLVPTERAVVPLPSPARYGFVALGILGLIGSRKAILRFVS
jgi:hypothetical protein